MKRGRQKDRRSGSDNSDPYKGRHVVRDRDRVKEKV